VRFADGVDARAEAAAASRAGARVSEVYTQVFPGFAAELPAAARDALVRRADVIAVTPDHIATLSSTSGTQSGATWGLHRIDQRALPLNSTYNYPGNGAGVRAYVIDSGILASHVDLASRVTGGRTWVNDGNGTSDCNGHGTHVAGTIGGTTWGVAKGVTLVPLRVFACTGGASYSVIIASLDWVIANHPAGSRGVVNMSLGGPGDSNLDAAVARTVSAGIPVVVAAGNSSADACGSSPARAVSATTVGATTSTDARASYSNFGTCLDLFAPGSAINSAWYTSTTATNRISGTSMASPHVAGAMALVLAAEPSLTPAAAEGRLLDAATTGVVTSAGTGSPNLLLHVAPAAPAPVVPTTDGQVARITVTANGGNWSSANAEVLILTAEDSPATMAGVEVTGSWRVNGTLQSATQKATTDAAGIARLASPTYKVRSATLEFCVRALSGGGITPVSGVVICTGTGATVGDGGGGDAPDDGGGDAPDDGGDTPGDGGDEPVAPITLTASGTKVKGFQQVQLSWTSGLTGEFIILRDGREVARTSSSSYLDALGVKGSGTYRYQIVLAADPKLASLEVIVTF
jgi:subtilisin family serine protease